MEVSFRHFGYAFHAQAAFFIYDVAATAIAYMGEQNMKQRVLQFFIAHHIKGF